MFDNAAYLLGDRQVNCENLHNLLAFHLKGSLHVFMDEIPTVTIYTRGSPLEAMILGMHKLSMAEVDAALELYTEQHDTVVGTVLGVTNDAAVFTSATDWRRDHNPEPADIHFVPWEEIHTLLAHDPR